MKADIRDTDSLRKLAPLEVASYLRVTGWNQVEVQQNGQVSYWEKGDHEILLPYRTQFGDYARRMHELLDTLSVVEDRSQLDIYADLMVTGADVLRVRLAADDLSDGSMPIEEFTQTAHKVRDLMLAAALSAIEHRPVWSKRKPDQATKYLHNVRIGQSERGSYVIKVIARVPPLLRSPTNLFDDPPYERTVTTQLAQALAALRQAAEQSATIGTEGSFENAVSEGVSANLCEAVVGLSDMDDSTRSLEFGFTWSPTRPVKKDQVSHIKLTPGHFPYLQEAARVLRERSPIDSFTLKGSVIKLERLESSTKGIVTINGTVDGEMKRVRVELDAKDYKEALHAHGNGTLVSCEGRLVREKQGHHLKNASNFKSRSDLS